MVMFSKSTNLLSEFLRYIAKKSALGEERIPPLALLSKELQVSIASLREQLEVARVLGFVEIKPKTGIRWLPYNFTPSMLLSVYYSITISPDYFDQFRDFRNHLEAAYFMESAAKLTRNDIEKLDQIVKDAEEKILSNPPQLPHPEHREFHATIFSKTQNTFAQSVFSVYWDVYEYQGYAIINDLDYLKRVWHYHRLVMEGIQTGNLNQSFDAFLEHKDLMIKNNKNQPSQRFE